MFTQTARSVRKLLSFTLACLLFALVLVFPAGTEAEASSGYHIKHWHVDFDDNHREDYYSVYKGDWEGVPTFYTDNTSVFLNRYTGQDVRITLYRSIEGNDDKAKAFCRYLEENTSYKHCNTGWYWHDLGEGSRQYYAFKIEGYNFDKRDLDLEDFLNRNPWENAEGLTLQVCFFDQGNVISEYWDLIWNDVGCSAGIVIGTKYFPNGLTFGFAFYDWVSGKGLVRRYCPNETW